MQSYVTMGPSNQYNATNAWNVNLNNGNVNNNTKTNGNQVRLVSEFCKNPDAPTARIFLDFMASVMEAYVKCIKTKIGNPNAAFYALRGIMSTLVLAEEMWNDTYKIQGGIAFTVRLPVWRECFAATLRDRIPHDWAMMREEPILETVFPDAITANRKGRGTTAAIQMVQDKVYEYSEGYTRCDLWLFSGDFRGFFMSIDKRIAVKTVLALNKQHYTGRWPEILDRLFSQIIYNCPQDSAIRRSPISTWINHIAPEKSLYSQDRWHGLAIGNLPSQWTACVIVMLAIGIMMKYGVILDIVTCMDDFIALIRDKEAFLKALPLMEKELKEKLNVTLHPVKRNLQHYSKGWKFVGGKGRNGRLYASDRVIRRARAKIHYYCTVHDLDGVFKSVNSYFGILSKFCTYKIRKELADKVLAVYGHELYFDGQLTKCTLKKQCNQRKQTKEALRLIRSKNVNRLNYYRNAA